MDKPALVVTLNQDYDIRFVQHLEQVLKEALVKSGFCLTGSSKYEDGTTELKFYQFAVALGD